MSVEKNIGRWSPLQWLHNPTGPPSALSFQVLKQIPATAIRAYRPLSSEPIKHTNTISIYLPIVNVANLCTVIVASYAVFYLESK